MPQADPARAAAASREATAIEQGRFRMERQAAAAAEQASPTVSRQLNDARIEEVAQRALGVVANRIGSTAPDQLAALPRGVYERFLANEPALAMVMREYGLGIDDVVAAMQRRGFALQPFNGNVMQQYQPGRSGALPMTAEEKALRDAIHRRQKSLDRQNYDR